MTNSEATRNNDLPSSARLIRSTLFSLIVAGLVLAVVVLPREHGISPLDVPKLYGIGGRLAAETVSAKSAELGEGRRRDEVIIRLLPEQSAELKLAMRQGATIVYAWSTDGGGVNFNVHGDPHNPAQAKSHRYGAGQEVAQDNGTIEAVFDGEHGWYWKNRTAKTVHLTIRTEGVYSAIKRAL